MRNLSRLLVYLFTRLLINEYIVCKVTQNRANCQLFLLENAIYPISKGANRQDLRNFAAVEDKLVLRYSSGRAVAQLLP